MEDKVMKKTEELIAISKSDIKASKTLFEGGQYPQSLFYFQQSVEKSVKYIGLIMQCMTEEQMAKDIKHEPLKVFQKMFKHLSLNSNGMLPVEDVHLFTNVKQIIITHSEMEGVNMAWNQINSIVSQPKLIDESIDPFEAVCRYISSITPLDHLKLDEQAFHLYAKKRLQKQTTEIILLLNYGTRVLQLMMIYSLLLSRYKVDDFRYPSDMYGNPDEYFNKSNPLIENMGHFINGMEGIIPYIEKIPWVLSEI